LESSQALPAKFRTILSEGASAAKVLRRTLSAAAIDPRQAKVQMAKVNVSCISCHQAFRD
jgi:cytochrome c556